MRPIRVPVSSATTSQVVPLDQYISPENVTVAVVLSAGASLTYKVQYTFDDVFAATFNPATANWNDHATLVSKTASADGNFAFPVTGVRLNVTPYTSGTATLTVLQAGLT